MPIELYTDQIKAIDRLRTGSILCGGVGSGKSRTALAYYLIKVCGAELKINGEGKDIIPPEIVPLYIITTGKKRDSGDWEMEAIPFYKTTPIVDSWNNIKKYKDVKDSFFIFDEQRVVGYGEWSKTFIKIARNNNWILLSATPGDTWIEYAPVFIANNFYKDITEFRRRHIVYNRYTKYPKIERYVDVERLERLRSKILVDMKDNRITIPHQINVKVDYNRELVNEVEINRWNVISNQPIETASEYCALLRKIVNSDQSRTNAVIDILNEHPKLIIFYNFNYELEILRNLLDNIGYPYSEWNGHKHEEILKDNKWVYLVQYSAGAEGWNCIETDSVLYFSQNYSFKIMEQASGRINRVNTPFVDLYYFHLISDSKIDKAILRALRNKKKFNERTYYEFN